MSLNKQSLLLNLIKLSLITWVFLLKVIKQAALERPFLAQKNSSFALVYNAHHLLFLRQKQHHC